MNGNKELWSHVQLSCKMLINTSSLRRLGSRSPVILLAVGIGSFHSADIWRSKGVKYLLTFRSKKKLVRFFVSGLTLNKFIGYAYLIDAMKFGPKISKTLNKKNSVRHFCFL